ncbi:alpha_adaptinC2 domain-containing protein, partial [Haematococcus lacustris]
LLEKAGDFVSDDIWHRVVQLVTNNPTMQQYAASSTVEMLRRGAAHESLVCTAAYLLGEYGRLVSDQGLLMTAYIKLHLADPGDAALHREVMGLFERYQKFMDAELQQRASEYL